MIGYEFVNLNQALQILTRYERGLESLTALWELFGPEFYAQETTHFTDAPFAPLSPGYAERKRRDFGSKPILRALDDLFKSFTKQGATGNVHEISAFGAAFGSRDIKAVFHQEGTSIMPARPPLAKPNLAHYEKIAGDYLMDMVTRATN